MSYVKGVTKSALQKVFLALQASVWSKNEGGGASLDPPLLASSSNVKTAIFK